MLAAHCDVQCLRLDFLFAGIAQLVEHFLAKEDVASSSLVTRSTLSQTPLPEGFLFFRPRPLSPENFQVTQSP